MVFDLLLVDFEERYLFILFVFISEIFTLINLSKFSFITSSSSVSGSKKINIFKFIF